MLLGSSELGGLGRLRAAAAAAAELRETELWWQAQRLVRRHAVAEAFGVGALAGGAFLAAAVQGAVFPDSEAARLEDALRAGRRLPASVPDRCCGPTGGAGVACPLAALWSAGGGSRGTSRRRRRRGRRRERGDAPPEDAESIHSGSEADTETVSSFHPNECPP